MSGATALAEGGRKFKVDVDLIFNHLKATDRKYILRTVYDDLSVWKAKYAEVNVSPQGEKHENQGKEFAIVDGEVWVFRVDATSARDIVIAVQIAKHFYKVDAEVLLRDIYIKNLNAECEHEMGQQALISANKSLYARTCEAIKDAGRELSVKGEIKLHVFSNNRNPKIPQQDLHSAIRSGGSNSVSTDPARYQYHVSNNRNTQDSNQKPFFTHHHIAIFDL